VGQSTTVNSTVHKGIVMGKKIKKKAAAKPLKKKKTVIVKKKDALSTALSDMKKGPKAKASAPPPPAKKKGTEGVRTRAVPPSKKPPVVEAPSRKSRAKDFSETQLSADSKKVISKLDDLEVQIEDLREEQQTLFQKLSTTVGSTFLHPDRGPMSIMERGEIWYWRVKPSGRPAGAVTQKPKSTLKTSKPEDGEEGDL
jgi:hypothetical protein